MKEIWSGTWSLNGKITVPELPYYNIIIAECSQTDYRINLIGLFNGDRTLMMVFSALATGGESYQNAYLYGGIIRVDSSISITLTSLSRSKLYTGGTEQDKSLSISKIIGVL